MKLKNILFQACALAGGTIILSSCNDFLDREPLSSVTPEVILVQLTILKLILLPNITTGFQAMPDMVWE